MTKVIIEGEKKDIEKIKETVKGNNSIFSFQRIKHMPQEMMVEHMGSGDTDGQLLIYITEKFTKTLDELNPDDKELLNRNLFLYNSLDEKYKNRKEIFTKTDAKRQEEDYKFGEQKYKNIKKYGAADWYPWSINNWGTKWDCNNARLITENENELIYEFETAWSVAAEALAALSEQFPKVTISVLYADEDIGSNCGMFQIKDSCEIFEWFPEDEHHESHIYAQNVWGYDPDGIIFDAEEYWEYDENQIKELQKDLNNFNKNIPQIVIDYMW